MRQSIALLAHQGGWDEILLVTVPIVVIIALLAVAKRRVDAELTNAEPVAAPEPTDTPEPPVAHD